MQGIFRPLTDISFHCPYTSVLRFMCQLMDWRKGFGVFDKPRIYFFSSYRQSSPHVGVQVNKIDTLQCRRLSCGSEATVRQSISLAFCLAKCSRRCCCHSRLYVSLCFGQLSPSRSPCKPGSNFVFTTVFLQLLFHFWLLKFISPFALTGMKKHLPTRFSFPAPAVNLTD